MVAIIFQVSCLQWILCDFSAFLNPSDYHAFLFLVLVFAKSGFPATLNLAGCLSYLFFAIFMLPLYYRWKISCPGVTAFTASCSSVHCDRYCKSAQDLHLEEMGLDFYLKIDCIINIASFSMLHGSVDIFWHARWIIMFLPSRMAIFFVTICAINTTDVMKSYASI